MRIIDKVHKCDVCGDELLERDLFGTWGDYCQDCWNDEGRETEEQEDEWSEDDEE